MINRDTYRPISRICSENFAFVIMHRIINCSPKSFKFFLGWIKLGFTRRIGFIDGIIRYIIIEIEVVF